MLNTVFFDAGNTLFRETPLRWEIYARVGREHGLSIEVPAMRRAMIEVHEELPRRVHGGFRYGDAWFSAYIPRVFARFGAKSEQIPAISEQLFAAFRTPGTFQLFPETMETLASLESLGVKMAIISNWSPRLPRICTALGVDRYMRFILASAIEELEKPDPQFFRKAMTMIGSSPWECLHVGDSLEKDVQGAAAAGILGGLVEREGAKTGVTSGAPEGMPRFASLRELIPFVERKMR